MESPLLLITGDTGTLGSVLVRTALEKGFRVLGISRKDFTPSNPAHIHISADVTKDTNTLIASCIKTYGIPKLVISNVGAFVDEKIENMTSEQIDVLLRTNITTPVHILQALASHYKGTGKSANQSENRSVIFISSAGMDPAVLMEDGRAIALYGASKAALSILAVGASKEFSEFGVRINTIAPPYFTNNEEKTERVAQLCFKLSEDEAVNGSILRERTPPR